MLTGGWHERVELVVYFQQQLTRHLPNQTQLMHETLDVKFAVAFDVVHVTTHEDLDTTITHRSRYLTVLGVHRQEETKHTQF